MNQLLKALRKYSLELLALLISVGGSLFVSTVLTEYYFDQVFYVTLAMAGAILLLIMVTGAIALTPKRRVNNGERSRGANLSRKTCDTPPPY